MIGVALGHKCSRYFIFHSIVSAPWCALDWLWRCRSCFVSSSFCIYCLWPYPCKCWNNWLPLMWRRHKNVVLCSSLVFELRFWNLVCCYSLQSARVMSSMGFTVIWLSEGFPANRYCNWSCARDGVGSCTGRCWICRLDVEIWIFFGWVVVGSMFGSFVGLVAGSTLIGSKSDSCGDVAGDGTWINIAFPSESKQEF